MITAEERARLREQAEWAARCLRPEMHVTIWDTVAAVPDLLDALDDADARIAALESPPAPMPPDVALAMAQAEVLLLRAEVARLAGELHDLRGYVQPNATSPATDLRGLAEREAGR